MTEKELQQYRDIKNERDHLKALLEKTDNECPYASVRRRLRLQYDDKIQQLSDQLSAIENAIETLEPRERQAIRMHYIDGLSWEDVGYKMYYERSQIFRIRKTAIEKLKNV
jgi:RNA polymerase sigma factor (sigma-70 family)